MNAIVSPLRGGEYEDRSADQNQQPDDVIKLDVVAEKVTCVIPEGVTITGDIHATEGIRIDGKIVGSVTSDSGTVIVGETGSVCGAVSARGRVIILGSITPASSVSDTLPLAVRAFGELVLGDAIIQGVIEYSTLDVRGDASISGKLRKVAA